MKLTHGVLALMVGSSLTFAATKEFPVVEDNSMRNSLAEGDYSDQSCYSADSDKLTIVHYCC